MISESLNITLYATIAAIFGSFISKTVDELFSKEKQTNRIFAFLVKLIITFVAMFLVVLYAVSRGI